MPLTKVASALEGLRDIYLAVLRRWGVITIVGGPGESPAPYVVVQAGEMDVPRVHIPKLRQQVISHRAGAPLNLENMAKTLVKEKN